MTIGQNRYYYYEGEDGTKQLVAMQVDNSRYILFFPSGSTIDVLPAESVGTREIKNGGVEMEDLHQNVKDEMITQEDRVTQEDIDNFNV